MDTDKIWEEFLLCLSLDLSPNNKFKNLLSSISKIAKDESINNLSKLNIEIENQDMANWITEFLNNSSLPNTIKSFWIGIFQYESEKNEIVYGTYMSGCDSYIADDIEWACDATYVPERYYTIEVINDFFRQIPPTTEEDMFEMLDWIIPLAISCFNYKFVIECLIEKNIFLQHQKEMHFSCGYDNGDYTNLITLKRN